MRNWSGYCATIARVCVPIEPVEPRRDKAFTDHYLTKHHP
jgi:hypothetical protein